MQNLTRRFFVLAEARKGNYETAAAVSRESKYLEIRDSKKETVKVSNSKL